MCMYIDPCIPPTLFWPMLINRAVKLLLEHIHTVVNYIAPHLV